MHWTWLGLLPLAVAHAAPESVPPTAIPPQALEVAAEVRHEPLADRVAAISEAFVGRDYVLDAAGEGHGTDPDPPARYDAFDCVTFTEEVLALAMSGEPTHAAFTRQAMRYDGEITDYAYRNHFMELQWIPNNVEAGFLEDITGQLGPTRQLSMKVDDTTWRNWGRRSLFELTDEQLPTGTMSLDILPLPQAIEHADQVPPGSVIMTVREPRAGVPLWITHVGIAIRGDDGVMHMRHATKMGSGSVTDHRLHWYLNHIASAYKRWPAAGIAVFAPREQGPRLSALQQPPDAAGVAVPDPR